MVDDPVVAIVGPTAVGKTAVGVQVAERVGGEIISVDSRQIYRYMNIGTAKPAAEDLRRVTHHFIDIRDPDEAYNAGTFGREVRLCVRQLHNRGVVPILVGGSGLYLQAVLDGFFIDDTDYSDVRAELTNQFNTVGRESIRNELKTVDPYAFERLDPNDTQRLLRALEIARSGARRQGQRWREDAEGVLSCTPLGFCLHRQRNLLYGGIDRRVHEMVAAGFVHEVAKLRELGYGQAETMGTLGYEEISDYIDGATDLAISIESIQRRTRRYAKRQLTWFRRDRRLRWLDVDEFEEAGVVERIVRRIGVARA